MVLLPAGIDRVAGKVTVEVPAFAETARLYDYCRPEVGDEGRLVVVDGRHPVLEQHLTEERPAGMAAPGSANHRATPSMKKRRPMTSVASAS